MELVERSELLGMLSGFLGEARRGSGSVVLVSGEAGVGKTSLARAFLAGEGTRARVLWGSCEPLVTPEPLGPFHDMAPLAAAVAGGLSRAELLNAFLDALRHAASTIMVVEDAHWADEATLDALRFLGRRVHQTPGMLLVTYRDDEAVAGGMLRSVLGDLATAPGVHRLVLPPLSMDAVTELAEGHAVDAARLHRATGGNPFYVTEVLAAAGWTVPATISDAVLARAARLEASARSVLDVVSLSPGGLEPDMALGLAGGSGAALDACLERGMLVMAGERVAFRHELARLAIEEALQPQHRKQLQKALLERFQSAGVSDSARLAHHADAAGDVMAVLRYEPLAAREASERGAHRAAAEHLGRAVARAGSQPPGMLADLVSFWADERTPFDDPREVIALRKRVVELRRAAGDRQGEARELIELSRMTSRVGGATPAQQYMHAGLEILEALAPGPELATAYAYVAYGDMTAGRWVEALQEADRAIELAAAFGADAARVRALRVRATVEYARGSTEEAAESYAQAHRLALAAGDSDDALAIIIDLGLEHMWRREYGKASIHLWEAVEFGRGIDLDFRTSFAESCLAQIDFDQGRWAEAQALAGRLLAAHQRNPDTRLNVLAILGRIAVRRGLPGGEEQLAEAGAATDRGETSPWEIHAGLAEAAWLRGDVALIPGLLTESYAEVMAEAADWQPARWPAGELAFWLWRADALPKPPPDIAEPWALHIAGDWRGAAQAWERLGCPYEQAQALADGDEPAMREALAIFSRLGAEPAADRLRERMRRAGVTRVPARPRNSTRISPAQLTRRQIEILQLVERGLTNSEIGSALFITEKTAGHHVSAILAKLGARSRTEAASTARKMGIVAPQT